jgi:hypothetical protein
LLPQPARSSAMAIAERTRFTGNSERTPSIVRKKRPRCIGRSSGALDLIRCGLGGTKCRNDRRRRRYLPRCPEVVPLSAKMSLVA